MPDEKWNPASQVWLGRMQVTPENQTLPNFNIFVQADVNMQKQNGLAKAKQPQAK